MKAMHSSSSHRLQGLELDVSYPTTNESDAQQQLQPSSLSLMFVKVLSKSGEKVEAGQPAIAMEAIKMEHVVKAPSSGFIHGLQVAPGKQISDGSVFFSVKEQEAYVAEFVVLSKGIV